MKIEEQVCTIEQGDKLRSLGIYAESLHSWFARKLHSESEYKNYIGKWHPSWNKECAYSYYSEIQLAPAFTVAELGAMFGKGTKASELFWQYLLDCVNSGLSSTVCFNPIALTGHIIAQIENKTLLVEEVNQRLLNHTKETI